MGPIHSPLELLPTLLRGLGVTIEITLSSAILAFLIAFFAGLARMSKVALIRWIAATYVEIFRGTSLLVQMFWLYFALPMFGVSLPPFMAGVLALGLNYGSYGSEVVRSAILAVPKGQHEAGIALNMLPSQRLRLIIFPQALSMMLPGLGNLLIELLKGTSLVSLITLADLTYQAMILRATDFQTPLIFSMLLILYFAIAFPLTLGVRWLERRASAGRSL